MTTQRKGEPVSGGMKPTLGRIVIYSSETGDGVLSPAVVLRTRDTCVEEVAQQWLYDPAFAVSAGIVQDHDAALTQTAIRPPEVVDVLADDDTVDLLVHGLGRDYRRYNVTQGTGPGQWSWPARVPA